MKSKWKIKANRNRKVVRRKKYYEEAGLGSKTVAK